MSDDKLRALERKFRKEPEKVREEYACELWRIGQEHTAARLFMKENFLGVSEVEKQFGVLLAKQRKALKRIPFTFETLWKYRKTHVLVADIGSSILQVYLKKFPLQGRFNDEAFILETDAVCWRLICKTHVNKSRGKLWCEQKKLIPETDEVPSARQVVYMIILNFLSTGDRLFETTYVRTTSVWSDGDQVDIGFFQSVGLHLLNYRNFYRYYARGVSSAVKPDR